MSILLSFLLLTQIAISPLSSQISSAPIDNVQESITSFSITTESAMNDNVIVLNVDTALPEKSAATSIKWYLNGTEYVSWVQPFAKGDTEITLTFGDAGNASAKNLTSYAHYFIPSGTDFGAGCTLNDDYSFWWAHHSGGAATMAWSFQHGGAGAIWNHEIPSIHIAELNADSGAQDANERFVVNFDITKEAGVYSETSWNAASVMMATGSGEYSLYDYAPGSNIVYGNDQIMAKSNKDATSGTWGLLIYYAPLGIASGDNTARSFWIPKGTLYGGFNENYGFYVDNDVYFDWTGTELKGTFDGRHTYVKVPAKCGHPGNIEYYTCSRHEGEYFLLKEGKYVPATKAEVEVDVEHNYGEEIPEVPSTCTSDGVKAHYECSVCHCLFIKENGVYKEVTAEELVIPASHSYVHVAEVKAACTSDGVKEHYECSVCHKLFLLVGESYIEVKAEDLKIPSCHETTIIKGKPATCKEEGLTDGLKCTVCGEIIQKQIVIPALGHSFGGWTFFTRTDGTHYIYRICTRCEEEETVEVSSANGFTSKVIKESTSTSDGIIRYYSTKYGEFDESIPAGEGKGVGSKNLGLIIAGSTMLALALAGGVSLTVWFLRKKKRS